METSFEEDLEVDDILGNENRRKKKVNGKKKGNRVELELCKKLTKHHGDTFSRSVGSGNRWGQVSHMPAHAKATLVGDICAPEKYKWVIECKGGYDDDVDFSSVFDGGCSRIDSFIEQSENDAKTSGRLPIIMWKRSRKPWLAMIKTIDFNQNLEYHMHYKNWSIVSLDALLKNTEKGFWFDE